MLIAALGLHDIHFPRHFRNISMAGLRGAENRNLPSRMFWLELLVYKPTAYCFVPLKLAVLWV